MCCVQSLAEICAVQLIETDRKRDRDRQRQTERETERQTETERDGATHEF